MNVRLAPDTYIVDGLNIWYVDGYTSDNPEEWVLMITSRDFSAIPHMNSAIRAVDISRWDLTFWQTMPDPKSLINFKIMVGNLQRTMKNIPAVREFFLGDQ